jgi:polyisoprenoid-binding protein YceI
MGLSLWRKRSKSDSGRAGLLSRVPVTAGVLSLEVLDPVGHPLNGAEVQLKSNSTGRLVMKGPTDPYGMFNAALPPGRYAALITADGMLPVQRTADIMAGNQDTVRAQLEAARPLDPPQPGVWVMDPPHTAIRFIAKHVGMANVHGRFTRFDGGIRIAERPEDSYVECTIDAASISTGNKTRDTHLRSADFLDVENYPYIHFASTRFANRGGNKWALQGTLSMHGVSRSLTLDTDYFGFVNGGYGEELRCAGRATAELHREDYTLNWRNMLAKGIAIVGPTVQLELDVQAMHRSQDTPTPPE